jgi:hypothetical protein
MSVGQLEFAAPNSGQKRRPLIAIEVKLGAVSGFAVAEQNLTGRGHRYLDTATVAAEGAFAEIAPGDVLLFNVHDV